MPPKHLIYFGDIIALKKLCEPKERLQQAIKICFDTKNLLICDISLYYCHKLFMQVITLSQIL